MDNLRGEQLRCIQQVTTSGERPCQGKMQFRAQGFLDPFMFPTLTETALVAIRVALLQ